MTFTQVRAESASAPAAAEIPGGSVVERLETIPHLPIHTRWAATIGAGCFLDGFTTLVVAAAMPVLIATLHIDFAKVGLLISASFIGMFFGAFLFGALSERYGRRTMFCTSITMFGALSIVASFAWSYDSLFWLRLVQGFGLGGAVPVAAALMAECLPASARGRTFSFTYALLFSLGYFVAPLAAVLLIALLGPEMGWRALFATAGIALPFGIAAWWLLPESPRWLALVGRQRDAESLVDKLEAEAAKVGRPLAPLNRRPIVIQQHPSLLEAFGAGYLGRTALICTLFLTVYFVQYGLNAWLPTLYVKVCGLSPKSALGLSVGNGLVTVAAAVVFAVTVDRIGRRLWFIIGFGLGLVGIAAGILALSVFHLTAWPVLFSAAVLMTAGTGVNAGSVYLYGPELFPTRMRSWSTSVGSAFGRLGSIIAPVAIGRLLQAQLGLSSVFALLGLACAIGLLAITAFGIETKRRALEDIAH